MRDPCQLMFCSQPSLPPTQIISYAEEWRADRLQATRAIESAHPAPQPRGLRYCTTASRNIAESWAFGSLASFLRTISSANRRPDVPTTLQHPIHAASAVP